MCKFCEKEDIILEKEVISTASWGWGGDISIRASEAMEDKLSLFLDKRDIDGQTITYLRLVDEDSNCIESGEKVKINFCPFCGESISRITFEHLED